jgi:hypothetical protein
MMMKKVVAEELVIVNSQGETRAVLRAEGSGTVLHMFSAHENRSVVLQVGRTEKDQVSLSLCGDDQSTASIGVDEEGNASVYLSDPTGRRRIQAGITSFGGIRIDLIDMDKGDLTLKVSDDETELDLSRRTGEGITISSRNGKADIYVGHEIGHFDAGLGGDAGGGWVQT